MIYRPLRILHERPLRLLTQRPPRAVIRGSYLDVGHCQALDAYKLMTADERFERIESNLLAMTETQAAWQNDFRKAMDGLVEAHTLQQKSLATLTASVAVFYVDESNARVKRLEENLDALIRAITSEHSNGKTPH